MGDDCDDVVVPIIFLDRARRFPFVSWWWWCLLRPWWCLRWMVSSSPTGLTRSWGPWPSVGGYVQELGVYSLLCRCDPWWRQRVWPCVAHFLDGDFWANGGDYERVPGCVLVPILLEEHHLSRPESWCLGGWCPGLGCRLSLLPLPPQSFVFDAQVLSCEGVTAEVHLACA